MTFSDFGLLVKSEPLLVRQVTALVLTVLAAKGLDLDLEQVLAVFTTFVGAATVFARRKVTPVDPEVVASKKGNA